MAAKQTKIQLIMWLVLGLSITLIGAINIQEGGILNFATLGMGLAIIVISLYRLTKN